VTTQATPPHSTVIVGSSSKLDGVLYDLRGPVHRRATELERHGHEILRLNIGNPAPFGFEAPDVVVGALRDALPHAHGYSDSQGLDSAREAIRDHYAARPGFPDIGIDDIVIGNGVSELVTFTLQALLEPGDEVLVPSPDYPLWTASTVLAGGVPRHYPCDESAGWLPDVAELERMVTSRTRAIVVINPNNPTGAVYPQHTLDAIAAVADRRGLLLLSDEIYDRIVYPGHVHIPTAQVAPTHPCLTFSGLSKTSRVAGYRAGWVAATGFDPRDGFLTGLRLLASMRMCASVPAQHAIRAALRHDDSITALRMPGGRLFEQRALTVDMLRAVPGVSCHEPGGGLYAFPHLDPDHFGIVDDEQLVLDFLDAEHVLLVHGRAFNWPRPDHLRIAFLPDSAVLADALGRFARFLTGYRQRPRRSEQGRP